MTPRLEWTFKYNWLATAAIRLHCKLQCACEGEPDFKEEDPALYEFVKDYYLRLHPDGSITEEKKGSQESQRLVLPPQNGPRGPVSGTCGADGRQFCTEPWPAEFGSIPDGPVEALQTRKSGPPGNTVCGGICTSKDDCKTVPDMDCYCALPSPADARALGLDPLFAPAVCLALAHIAITHIPGRVGGRDTETKPNHSYLNELGEPYRCLCNSTAASPYCCEP